MKRKLSFTLMLVLLQSCASYKYAQQIKMVSFDDNVKKGKSAGPIQGKDCTWMVAGYWLGGNPTVDKAFLNAMNQAGMMESAGAGSSKDSRGQKIRYINNANTDTEGFNALGIVGKQCIVVNGVGYL